MSLLSEVVLDTINSDVESMGVEMDASLTSDAVCVRLGVVKAPT
jgi:hypothetical protein